MQNATYHEILNQPTAWTSTLDVLDSLLEPLLGFWRRESPRPLIFTGCGSPYYLAQSVATVFREAAQSPAEAYPASNIWLFPRAHLAQGNPLLVCISRSGETTEMLQAVEVFRSHGHSDVLSVTCYSDSALSGASSASIALPHAQETSLAQTQSFTSMLVATLQLAHGFANGSGSNNLRSLPAHCEALLTDHHDLARRLGQDQRYERFFFLGGGAVNGIANEGMLKMKEMTLTYAEAYHFLEFRHGPMAMVDDKTLVIGLVSDLAMSQEVQALRELRNMGAQTLALTPRELPADAADYQVALPETLSEAERLPLYLPIIQLIACYRATARGLNPDKPENLSAFVKLDVTATKNESQGGTAYQ